MSRTKTKSAASSSAQANAPVDTSNSTNASDASQPHAPNGRAPNGQFGQGNSFARGNPFGRKLAAMRQAVLSAVTEDDVKAVMAMLLQKALEGDVAAAKLVLQYAVGKPAPAPEPDRLEIDEWKLREEASLDSDIVLGTMDLATAKQANFVVGHVQPIRHKEVIDPFIQEMLGETPPGSAKKAWLDILKREEDAENGDFNWDRAEDDDPDAGEWTGGPLHTASYGPKPAAS